MKAIIIIWIWFQLSVMVISSVSINNKIIKGEYDCPANKTIISTFDSIWGGVLFPLLAVYQEPAEITDFCSKYNK